MSETSLEPLDPDFHISLPDFEGPLDLLLHLIRKHELDILDLPIAFVTERYLEYVTLMEKLDLDIASEYLVMAATLAHIKSKMLLPQEPDDQDDEEPEEEVDPRAELIRRLLEYQKYKVAAEQLGARPIPGRDVFGRGSEEAETLAREGIPFEVVPGVPSPMAATAYGGLSLTHRTRSSSVAYLTATESKEKDRSSHDWAKLATGPETLVIFMGMRKLPSLMQLLMENGRPADTPAAVIQWASLPRQRTVVGTVGDIAEKARSAGIGLPALTIVGAVVELRETLRWYDTLPLFGQRVLVTRPAHQNDEMARLLRDEGAEPVTVPAIRILPPADPGPLEEAVREISRYRWIVLTSANGVRALFEEIERQQKILF